MYFCPGLCSECTAGVQEPSPLLQAGSPLLSPGCARAVPELLLLLGPGKPLHGLLLPGLVLSPGSLGQPGPCPCPPQAAASCCQPAEPWTQPQASQSRLPRASWPLPLCFPRLKKLIL